MSGSERFKPAIPEYVKYMKDDALFSVRDLVEMFGYKSEKCVYSLVDRKMFPEHDKISHSKHLWKKSTVMNYIKETWGDL
jgi:predicted DNA-binding transcriptional regulator AlpA